MEKKEIKREETYADILLNQSDYPTGFKRMYTERRWMGVNELHQLSRENKVEYLVLKNTKLTRGFYYAIVWKS